MPRATPASQYYVILKHNFRTGESAEISEAAKGRGRAEAAVERLSHTLTRSEKEAGWAFMLKEASRAGAMPYVPPVRRRPPPPKRRSYTGR
jgi:hypothetical protein